MNTGQLLREARKSASLPLKTVAGAIGVTPQALSQFERNAGKPNQISPERAKQAMKFLRTKLERS